MANWCDVWGQKSRVPSNEQTSRRNIPSFGSNQQELSDPKPNQTAELLIILAISLPTCFHAGTQVQLSLEYYDGAKVHPDGSCWSILAQNRMPSIQWRDRKNEKQASAKSTRPRGSGPTGVCPDGLARSSREKGLGICLIFLFPGFKCVRRLFVQVTKGSVGKFMSHRELSDFPQQKD